MGVARIVKYCEACGREIGITNHYCLKCLKDKLKPFHSLVQASKIKASVSVKEEMQKLVYETENVNKAPFHDLIREYLIMLDRSPILFSELQIPVNRFTQIARHLKYNNPEIHMFKFKSGWRLDEGIVFYERQRGEAVTKLKNIYPKLRIPRSLTAKIHNPDYGKFSEQENSINIIKPLF